MLHLKATVPLVVLGDISERPTQHYLTPGQPSPVILASPADLVFPPVRPVITEEPLVSTSERLMRTDGTFDPIQSQRNFWNQIIRDSLLKTRLPIPLRIIITGITRVCSGRRLFQRKGESIPVDDCSRRRQR
jgi:hypothetical protein